MSTLKATARGPVPTVARAAASFGPVRLRRIRGTEAGVGRRAGAPKKVLGHRDGRARVWLLTAVMAALTFALLSVGPLARLAPVGRQVGVTWWLLALAFGVVEVFVIHVRFRGDAHSISLSETPLLLGLFFVSPRGVVLAQLAGAGVTLALHRRQGPLKLAFNLSQLTMSTCAAAALFHGIVALGDPLGPAGWAASFAATFTVDVLAGLMINLAISLSQARRPRFPHVFGIGSVAVVTNTCLALVATTILWLHPTSAWLLLALVTTMLLAYHAYGSLRHKHDSLELLYESTRVTQGPMQDESMVLSLLAKARQMFQAEIAEVTLFGPADPKSALRTSLGPGDHTEVLRPVELDPTDGIWARVASEGQAVIVPRPIRNERLREHFSARGMHDAIVAPLRGDQGVVGVMLVANRLGDFSTFNADDAKVFETFANHASISLENGRLVDTLRRQAAEKEHQALHDALTGLPNRTLFRERLHQAIAGAAQSGSSVAVMLIDLDRFKEVNDTLGHHNGDLLLQEIGHRLRSLLRHDDTVARLGGDEFAILLPHVPDGAAAAQTARKILESLAQPLVLRDLALDIGASIGIALCPRDGEDADTLLQRADVAMYVAKEAHTGFELYSAERNQYSASRLALVAELRHAIQNKELSVVYQPKAELATGAITGVEALLRWQHPRQGFVPPDEFIQVAEHTGLIKPLTLYVLDVALAQCRAWELGGTPLKIAVNLSVRSLLDADLPRDVARLLEHWNVSPSSLQLEITESSIMADPARSLATLTKLSEMGVGLSIDDFGTGYSSLSHLKRLPVDEIKIDRSFVMGMSADENDAVIVRSIIDLGRNLGLRVVAEGVENDELMERLGALGCDVAQGYGLSRPLSAPMLADWLATHRPGMSARRLVATR
jgi:diguanylate cyclase (GGDEF)-like protein